MNARMPLTALLSVAITAAAPGAAYCAAVAAVRISAPVGAAFGVQAVAARVSAPTLAAPTLPGSASLNVLTLPSPAGQANGVAAAPVAALAVAQVPLVADPARPQILPEQNLLGKSGANPRAAAPALEAWVEHFAALDLEITGLAASRHPTRAAADLGRFFDRSGAHADAVGVEPNGVLPGRKTPKLELVFNLSKDGYRVHPEHVAPFQKAWAEQSKDIITAAADQFVTGGLKKLNREGSELFVYNSAERGGDVIYAVKFVSKKGIYLSTGFYLILNKNGRFTIMGDD